MTNGNSGFAEYRRLILAELERLDAAYESQRDITEGIRRDDLPKLRQDYKDADAKIMVKVTALEVKGTLKATLIGAVAGAVPAIVILLYFLANQ